MKLLLDEMLSAEIARQLRRRGHDVVAVDELPELRGRPDADILQRALGEQRTIVTYNRDGFLAIDREYRGEGRDHYGIVILNPRRFPQRAASIGALVASLEAFIATGPPYPSFVHWLQ